MWSPYSIENKSMDLSYDVYMDENGNLIPQNMSQELYIHSSSVTYEEYRNNNVTLIEDNVMIGNTMVNSSAMIVNNLNYPVEYIVSFNLIGEKRYFDYGSDGYSILNGTSTNISGIPVRWQSSGFVRGVKAYSNGTDALILPYAVDLKSGGAFFIDPTIGKKPLGETCSIYYYGSVSATLSAPSSAALGETITLSVTINSLSGSSPRKVNFYVSGDGQTDNIYSTSVTNGNTYSTSWTDNIPGNLTFCANYLYDRETCDYRGHIYTSYGYASLGSVSIHMDTVYKWIGYDGNNAIYLSSVGETPTIDLISDNNTAKINEKNGYRENAFSFNVSYSQTYTSDNNQVGCLLTNLYLGGSGVVATDCQGIGGPYVLLQGQLSNGPSASYLCVASSSDYSVYMGNVNSNGDSNAGEIASLMIDAFSVAASIAASEFSIPLGVLGFISSLISSVHETCGATTKVEDSGKVWQCFVLNGDDTSTYGSIEWANYSAGTRLKLTFPENALGSTGSSLTILGCSVGYDGDINFNETFSFIPAFAIYGDTENSNHDFVSGVNLYFNPVGTNTFYEVTSGSDSRFVFYANSDTTYNVFSGPNVHDISYVGNLPSGGHTITTGNLGSACGPIDAIV